MSDSEILDTYESSDSLEFVSCNVTIKGTAPYSQSHMHAEPWLDGESHEAYEQRTWRSKMNTLTLQDSSISMVVPGMAFQRSLATGAKFSKKQISGHGRSTWTKRFESGIIVMGDGVLNVDPKDVKPIVLPLNSDGRRGGGKRVIRWLPQIPSNWQCTFDINVLDPMITEDIFVEMVQTAGMFIGVGQFRPENGGMNGRFIIDDLVWADNRREIKKTVMSRR